MTALETSYIEVNMGNSNIAVDISLLNGVI